MYLHFSIYKSKNVLQLMQNYYNNKKQNFKNNYELKNFDKLFNNC